MGGIGDKIAKGLVGVLVGLMVLSFAVWGMEDIFSPGNQDAVVTLGETPVTNDEFSSAFRNEVNRVNEERGEALTNEEAYRLGIHRNVLDVLVTAKVIDIDANDLGIGADNRLARQTVEDMEVFQNSITGELDLEELDRRLRGAGLTRDEFEADILAQLKRAQTVPAIVGGITVPASFAEQRFRFLSEQRAADLLTLTKDAVPAPTEPTEADLDTWIADNARLYTAPEFRRFTLLRVEPYDLSPDLDVSEEELNDYYLYRLSLPPGNELAIASPETRDVVTIKARDEAQAKALATRLAAGEDAQLIASSVGAEAPTFLDDAVDGQILDPNVRAVAFDTTEGNASAVFGSLPFWYAVGVIDVTDAVQPSLEDVREELEPSLLEELAKDRLFDIVTEIEDALDGNSTFNEIADSQGIVLQTYDYLDRTGRTEDGLFMGGFTRIPGVATEDDILREAFVNDIGYETDLFETSSGGYAAVRVEDVKEARLRDMDEIGERARADYRADKLADSLRELSVTVQSRIRAGETIQAVSEDVGGEVERVIINRTARNPKVGDEIAVGLLDGKVGDVVRGAGPDTLIRQVAVLTRIQGTADQLAGTFRDTLTEGSRNEIASDIQNLYRQAVISANPIEQNDARIRSVLGIDSSTPQ